MGTLHPPDIKPAIIRHGSVCPPSYDRSCHYYIPSKADVEPALVRHGANCSPQYYRSRDYYIKAR